MLSKCIVVCALCAENHVLKWVASISGRIGWNHNLACWANGRTVFPSGLLAGLEFLSFSLSPSRTTPSAKPTIHPSSARRSGRPSGSEEETTIDKSRPTKPASRDNLTSASVHHAQQERPPPNVPARSKAPCSECCSLDGIRCVRRRRPPVACDLSRLVIASLISPDPSFTASHLASVHLSTLPHHHSLPLTGPSQRPKPNIHSFASSATPIQLATLTRIHVANTQQLPPAL